MSLNIYKTITWDILRCSMLWYEGADPECYGYDKEISRIGKNLADSLFVRAEKFVNAKGNVYVKYQEIAK